LCIGSKDKLIVCGWLWGSKVIKAIASWSEFTSSGTGAELDAGYCRLLLYGSSRHSIPFQIIGIDRMLQFDLGVQHREGHQLGRSGM
jgi:hypothetical protein